MQRSSMKNKIKLHFYIERGKLIFLQNAVAQMPFDI